MKNIKINLWKASLFIGAFFFTALLSIPAMAARVMHIEPGKISFQDAASPVMEKMEFFHNKLLIPSMGFIVIAVFALMLIIIFKFNAKANPVASKTTHNIKLEIIWTLLPILILMFISIPSMKMLYFMDKTADAEMTLKATGNQWYWDYSYPDNGDIEMDSHLIPEKDLKDNQPRLLATDNPVVLPINTNIRVLVTASDVLHSWAVPAFGIKLDAIPGRLNETWVRITKKGTFYGQCSEICGKGHGYMPIEIKAVSKADFDKWVVKHHGIKTKYKTDKKS